MDDITNILGISSMHSFANAIPRRTLPEEQAMWNAKLRRESLAEQGRNLVAVIRDRVQKLEAGLQAGESLVVFCDAGKEQISVASIEFPNWHLAVVSGLDAQNNQTHRIEHIQDIKLTCKIVKAPIKAAAIGFVLPTNV